MWTSIHPFMRKMRKITDKKIAFLNIDSTKCNCSFFSIKLVKMREIPSSALGEIDNVMAEPTYCVADKVLNLH